MAIPKKYPYSGCRALGHAWEVDEWRSPEHGEHWAEYVLVLRCLRCFGTRSDWIGTVGQVLYRRYDLPENYALQGWYGRNEWRTVWADHARPPMKKGAASNVIDITA
jgi:hypothetical protein